MNFFNRPIHPEFIVDKVVSVQFVLFFRSETLLCNTIHYVALSGSAGSLPNSQLRELGFESPLLLGNFHSLHDAPVHSAV